MQHINIFPADYKYTNSAGTFSNISLGYFKNEGLLRGTFNLDDMPVDLEVDAKPYVRLIEEYTGLLNSNLKGYFINNVVKSFIYNAAKFTPPRPSIGHISIQKNLYNRHVEKLSDVINSDQATLEDRRAVEKGMKFKVFKRAEGTIGTSKAAYGYAKTASEANQMKFIVNRGLARWSWGSDAPINCRPNSIDNYYAKRAPHLRKYHFNQVLIDEKNGEATVRNFSKDAAKYLYFARNKGLEAAKFSAMKILKSFTKNVDRSIKSVVKKLQNAVIKEFFGED